MQAIACAANASLTRRIDLIDRETCALERLLCRRNCPRPIAARIAPATAVATMRASGFLALALIRRAAAHR